MVWAKRILAQHNLVFQISWLKTKFYFAIIGGEGAICGLANLCETKYCPKPYLHGLGNRVYFLVPLVDGALIVSGVHCTHISYDLKLFLSKY